MINYIHRIAQSFFNFFGFQLVNTKADLLVTSEFDQIYEKCKPYSMTSKERMYALYKAVEYVVNAKIPGDFVECGVWKGGSSMVIAHTLLKLGVKDRKIYLYDTYEGMSEPTKEDKDMTTGKTITKAWKKLQKNNHNDWCYASIEEVKQNLKRTKYPSKQIKYIKGKVEDTIPNEIPDKISLLRLDTDWYESTKHEMKHLYPILSKNGVLLLDDYGCWEGAKQAVDEYFEDKTPLLLNRVDYTGRIAIKPK